MQTQLKIRKPWQYGVLFFALQDCYMFQLLHCQAHLFIRSIMILQDVLKSFQFLVEKEMIIYNTSAESFLLMQDTLIYRSKDILLGLKFHQLRNVIDKNMNFGGLIRNMSKMNQFLIVNLIFQKQASDLNKDLTIAIPFQGHFYLLDGDLKIDEKFDTKTDHVLEIQCPKGTRVCDDTQILYYSKLYDANYAFVIQFQIDAAKWPLSDNIHYSREYINHNYTGFLLALRYTCLFVSIVMCFAYIRKLQRINSAHWVIEQKLIVVLSGLLVLFNNPFYALTILFPNMASAFFEVLFIVNFFVFLLVFYLVILDRVIKENGQKISKALDKKKIAYGIALYFFLLLTYIGFSYNHLDDPYTSFKDSFGGFYEFCKWTGIVLLALYFCAILYFYVKVCQQYNSLIWRNRLFSLFSMYYIICAGIFAFTGSLNIYNTAGGSALLFITILNLYVYYLQYMYSFSPQGFQEADQIINLEVGNRPQIYEVLDDSLHGIELASQNGDHQQKLTNNNQAQEHMLAQDIFQQHQMLNQMKAPEEKETNGLTGNKPTHGNYYQDNQNHNNHHEYQQDIESNSHHPKQNNGNQPDGNSEYNQQNQQHDQEQNDGDLVLNFDQQKDDDEDY